MAKFQGCRTGKNGWQKNMEKETEEMAKILFPDGVIPDDGETEEEAKAAYQRLVVKTESRWCLQRRRN